MKTFAQQLRAEIMAHTGVTVVQTDDEERLLRHARNVAEEHQYLLWSWSLTAGLQCLSDENLSEPKLNEVVPFLGCCWNWQYGPSIVIAHDLVSWINHPEQNGPLTARLLRGIVEFQQDLNRKVTEHGVIQDGPAGPGGPEDPALQVVQVVVMDSEELQRPTGAGRAELELPDQAETIERLEAFCRPRNVQIDAMAVASALTGLAGYQQRQAVHLAYVASKQSGADQLDIQFIQDYKRRVLQARGITWVDAEPLGFRRLGGLEPLKAWLRRRAITFDRQRAAEYDVTPAKGMVIAGPPGCGKSAMVPALAHEWGDCPILRVDMGAIRSKWQGSSERNLLAVLHVADVMGQSSPVILHLDEADRGLAGSVGSGALDSGVAGRLFSTLLTWMAERTSQVFVYMTSNHPDALSPELTRAGRLDGSWWVSYFGPAERRAVIRVYTERFRKAAAVDVEMIVKASDQRTGSEIEAAFREAAIQSLAEGSPRISTAEIVAQLASLPKVADTYTVTPEVAKWRDSAMKANNTRMDDISDLVEPIEPSGCTDATPAKPLLN